ncbi:MAG: hypothetical protein CK424_03385 [Legionella sp.]|nr:MAG: hypothetical protein CK424_03385 [Legionella sp.]
MMSHCKKILITALICHALPLFAGVMGSENTPASYDGFYAGATLGLSNLTNKEQHIITPESHQLGSLGILGGGFVGYDYHINEIFNIGLEGFGNATGLNVSIQHDTQGTSYTTNSHYQAGLRVLPGYQFSPSMQGHIILGYSNAHFQVKDSGNYGYINTDFHKNGLQGGLGWTTQIIQGFEIRVDMMYTAFGSQSSTGTGLPSSGVPQQVYTNDFNTLEGDLSLVYKF